MVNPIANKKLSETDIAVQNYLDSIGIKVSAVYCGETIRDDNWRCDAWKITLTTGKVSNTFEYYTGTGHRKITPIVGQVTVYPVYPAVAGLLYSLQLDASACKQSFDDWCSEYGYDTDSRKALETYLLCQQNGMKYNQLFSLQQREAIAEMLQDY